MDPKDPAADSTPAAPAAQPLGRARSSWDDDEDEVRQRAFKRLSAEEAQALRAQDPPVSPWRVVAAQAVVGVVAAGLGLLVTGERMVMLSVLYGAGVVVIPAMLMARGMTSRLSGMNPGVGAVSFMLWEFVKIGASVGLLALAPKVVTPLSWPALLAGLVVCMKVYWVALLWRGRNR